MTDDLKLIPGLGAQKTASTWFFEKLEQIPDVACSELKELHLFDAVYVATNGGWENKFLARYKAKVNALTLADCQNATRRYRVAKALGWRLAMIRDPDAYVDYMRSICNGKSIVSEFTPAYSMLPREGFRRIEELPLDVHYFFCMRNPIDRYWSQLRMHQKNNPAIDVRAEFKRRINKSNYRLRGDYPKTLTTLFEIVPDRRITLGFYEFMNSWEYMQSIYTSLGLTAPDQEVVDLQRSKTLEDNELRAFAYREMRGVFEFVFDWFEGEIPREWLADMRAFS